MQLYGKQAMAHICLYAILCQSTQFEDMLLKFLSLSLS